MQTLRVLVLEDHAFQRSVAVSALKLLGVATVLDAADGREGLALLDRHGPVDIVLCDLRMPGMDGLAFLRHASQAGLVRAVMLCSELEACMRRSTLRMIELLGLDVLGDLGKPLPLDSLQTLLEGYRSRLPRRAPKLVEVLELPSLNEVQAGLQNGEFHAHYQPKFMLESGELAGAEVLVRWQHPRHGLLGPAGFLEVVECFGLLDTLFIQMFEQGLHLQRELAQQQVSLPLAFNLHPAQLASRPLFERIVQALSAHSQPASGVLFEITEQGLVQAPATSLEHLLRLRMLGCGLAIDDFGTGFSSLQRLSGLPFNQIKLAGCFVSDLGVEPSSAGIIGSTLELADWLGMSLVIEGVESAEQRRHLIDLGCTLGQGYWFAKPMGEGDLRAWLQQTGYLLA
ncbi:EAL domain-containing response regulator [Pseudomonas sp. UBA2684]|uniref:EAL domain-containing response regulator n=1 Tax=Pseudomonas sp. UBA2684 TaxID=1947311 RepID=UPI000E83DCC5|nr:EAL domain-containing response regulator [Pseudomonas sp. UBA2684]HBX55022.1 diguanylate phosphodiesterase [Pseudomonas sp.]|tara:strand:- start:1447 stop:2643 length:1197 start_codon:yes stop_codon:yes gene_type:complete